MAFVRDREIVKYGKFLVSSFQLSKKTNFHGWQYTEKDDHDFITYELYFNKIDQSNIEIIKRILDEYPDSFLQGGNHQDYNKFPPQICLMLTTRFQITI